MNLYEIDIYSSIIFFPSSFGCQKDAVIAEEPSLVCEANDRQSLINTDWV